MKALKAVNLTLLTTLLSLSCSKKQEASHTKADFPVNQAKIPVEVYPFNSLPIDHLLEEAKNYFRNDILPPIIPVEVLAEGQKPHAIRLIRSHLEIAKYIKAGDVFVSYEPVLTADAKPMDILQKGMPHAGIVIKNRQGGRDLLFPQKDNEDFICHLDTSSGWDPSGCIFEGSNHFFRIENSDPRESLDRIVDITNAVFDNWTYDPLFNLDLKTESDLQAMISKIENGSKTNLYCSELPYTLHSVAQERIIFEPTTFGKTIEEYNTFVENYGNLFDTPITSESSTDSIIEYFGSFLPSQSILDNYIIRSFVRSTMLNPNGLTSSWSGVSGKELAGMWVYMDEAKKQGSSVHYVGSYIPDSYKTISLPREFYSTVEKMAQLARDLKLKYEKSFFSENSTYKDLKIGFKKPSKTEKITNFVMGRKIPDFEGHTAASLGTEVKAMFDYLIELEEFIVSQQEITTEIFANTCYNIEYLSSFMQQAGYNLKTNLAQENQDKVKMELNTWAKEFFGDSSRLKILSDEFQCFSANYQ